MSSPAADESWAWEVPSATSRAPRCAPPHGPGERAGRHDRDQRAPGPDRHVGTAIPRERALAGIKSSRADIILGGALVLEAVLEVAGTDTLEVTRAGLREGVFFAERLLVAPPPLIADVRAAAVRNLVARHAVDPERAGRVAELAIQLHDSARETGAIKPAGDERQLLWAAAMLHDIGMAVGYDGHPNHSRYLLLNSELYGFTPRDVALVAQIVRHHRKGMPDLDEARSLARRGDRELVARCALLLRLATQLLPGDAASAPGAGRRHAAPPARR